MPSSYGAGLDAFGGAVAMLMGILGSICGFQMPFCPSSGTRWPRYWNSAVRIFQGKTSPWRHGGFQELERRPPNVCIQSPFVHFVATLGFVANGSTPSMRSIAR
jgi:hypothetical protein